MSFKNLLASYAQIVWTGENLVRGWLRKYLSDSEERTGVYAFFLP